MLTDSDLKQIADHGLSEETVREQIEHFVNGFAPSELVAPTLVGDGIISPDQDRANQYIGQFEQALEGDKEVVKFVPASGAATRMFKKLFAFLDEYDGTETAYEDLLKDQSEGSVYYFLKNLEHFAFYEELKEVFDHEGMGIEEAHLKRLYGEIIETVLGDKGLQYGKLPKGLLSFHSYPLGPRTPVQEHIVEGCNYAKRGDGTVNLHFTVSPEHLPKFKDHVTSIAPEFEKEFDVKVKVGYSIQKPSTDTIAVDLENEPFRNGDNTLLFRPAGHGALLENLNDIDADIIFLKNIDNVVPDRLKAETVRYKKLIAGILLDHQAQVFAYMEKLEQGVSDGEIPEIAKYITDHLGIKVSDEASIDELRAILDRPMRVCGMVSSDGDPGGGPFWVKSADGHVSLQVVETAQINLDDPSQKEIFMKATHFNPVDVVCGVRNYKGEKYYLPEFRDNETGFITQKSKDGKDLKAQELPGLWNGAMANWNTIFVEVPLITFNPVKAVNDLLLPVHQ